MFLMLDLFLLNRKFFHQNQDWHKKYFFRLDKKFYLQCKVWLMASYWMKVIFFSIFLALPKKSQSLCCLKTFVFSCVRMQTHIIHQCRNQTLWSLYIFAQTNFMSSDASKRYAQRGVSASKEDVHNAIKNIDKGLLNRHYSNP